MNRDQALVFAELAAMEVEDPIPPKHIPSSGTGELWEPDLNPTQKLMFDDPTVHILAYGEKGTGKSIGLLHKVVRHAYENENAEAIIITSSSRTGAEGPWHKLVTMILPEWKKGIGLEYTDTQMHHKTKDSYIWVGNRFGGWSKIMLITIQYGEQVLPRIRSIEPSFAYIDELTDCDSRDYFDWISAQIGRRPNITGPQQWTASCNPKGPSHWVYKVFFEVPGEDPEELENRKPIRDFNKGGRGRGAYDKDYAVYHVPIEENRHRLPPGYIEKLEKIFLTDEIEAARMLRGEWIDKPSGEAIFKDAFIETIHVVGDARKNQGILPVVGVPIIVSMDPGPVNFSIHMMQLVIGKDKAKWHIFDELNFVGRREPYFKVIPALMRRMAYWQNVRNTTFSFECISDEAAFNQLRADGSYDSAEIEKLSRQFVENHPELNLKPIRLKSCPKGKESVAARVRMVMDCLSQETIVISATCTKTIAMFRHLESKKEKEGQYDPLASFTPKRSAHIHSFDSMTYGMFYYHVSRVTRRPMQSGTVQPMVYTCGHGN